MHSQTGANHQHPLPHVSISLFLFSHSVFLSYHIFSFLIWFTFQLFFSSWTAAKQWLDPLWTSSSANDCNQKIQPTLSFETAMWQRLSSGDSSWTSSHQFRLFHPHCRHTSINAKTRRWRRRRNCTRISTNFDELRHHDNCDSRGKGCSPECHVPSNFWGMVGRVDTTLISESGGPRSDPM